MDHGDQQDQTPDEPDTSVIIFNGFRGSERRIVISLSTDKAMDMATFPRELYRLMKLLRNHLKEILKEATNEGN